MDGFVQKLGIFAAKARKSTADLIKSARELVKSVNKLVKSVREVVKSATKVVKSVTDLTNSKTNQGFSVVKNSHLPAGKPAEGGHYFCFFQKIMLAICAIGVTTIFEYTPALLPTCTIVNPDCDFPA